MKPPYFKVSAVCKNPLCTMTNWHADKKRKPKTADGSPGEFNALVCPLCKNWGDITAVQEVQ